MEKELDKELIKGDVVDSIIDILVGDLDNRNQIRLEQKTGRQIHPYAKHVTREITDRIRYLPEDLNCRFLLEESYYAYPDKPMQIKPLLFQLFKEDESTVRLHSKMVPERLDPEQFINSNSNWELFYYELAESPKFTPAKYIRQSNGNFEVNHPVQLGNGMKFTLIETLMKGRLEVMELLEKNGERVTPYDTPLIYELIE